MESGLCNEFTQSVLKKIQDGQLLTGEDFCRIASDDPGNLLSVAQKYINQQSESSAPPRVWRDKAAANMTTQPSGLDKTIALFLALKSDYDDVLNKAGEDAPVKAIRSFETAFYRSLVERYHEPARVTLAALSEPLGDMDLFAVLNLPEPE